MTERDQCLWRLQQTPGLGATGLARALKRCGRFDAGFFGREESWYREGFNLPERCATALARSVPPPPALAALPVRALLTTDSDYPAPLRSWKTPPPLLWTLDACAFTLTKGNVSVISSAGAEAANAEACKSAMQTAITDGFRLVAGHNRPVYQWALLAAKRRGAPSLMALDRGLLDAFDGDLARDPVSSARIWGYGFEPERCAVLSPFRLGDGWIGANSRARDALVVGLSNIVIALGVRPGGTMHRLCRQALDFGRTVYADTEGLSFLAEDGARPWTGRLDP